MKQYLNVSLSILNKYYLSLVFLISMTGTLGSLFFSELMHLPPCNLCWYQRIFLYPIFVISFIALIKRDNAVIKYIFALGTLGLLIATYHVLLQYTHLVPSVGCSAEISCASKDLDLFGFINIPLLSWLAFLSIFVLSMVKRIRKI